MQLSQLDLVIFGIYILGVIAFGIWIANRDKNTTASDYFLASRSLPWWAVGGSLIASNISAEQIIGMNGSGFLLGLAIATYELMAAITLILVAKFLLPVFLKKGIYTMPQFLEERYDGTARSIMSVFWIALYVFVNIASVLYLGGIAIEPLLGVDFRIGIIGLLLYSASFSIFGGLKAVVWTDIVQVVVLLIGGTVAAVGILGAVGDGSVFAGITELFQNVGGHFEMLFEPSDSYIDPFVDVDAAGYQDGSEIKRPFNDLPGLALLFGGMWIVNTYYWGNNQFIIQRALAAKDLQEAQRGVAFAALLKLFIPFFAVLPGIAAFYLVSKQGAEIDWRTADGAFPWVLGEYVGPGLKGLTFAALVAAIGSSISSMVNSASTIFTLDIYQKFIKIDASEAQLVRMGQLSATGALIIGAFMAPALGGIDQALQFIQEYTGFISPGVFTVFVFGMFWRRATPQAATAVIVASIPLSFLLKLFLPGLPFLDRMAFIFILSAIAMVVISHLTARGDTANGKLGRGTLSDQTLRIGLMITIIAIGLVTGVRLLVQPVPGVPNWFAYATLLLSIAGIVSVLTNKAPDHPKAIDMDTSLFKTSLGFNLTAIAIILILTAIYSFLA